MKKINILFILLISMLVCCQQKHIPIKNVFASNNIFTKLDTINGKSMIDDRCGIDAPNIKFFNDSLYYYYPTEGSYYKIINQEKIGNTILYNTVIIPSDNNVAKNNFKVIKLNDSLLKIYKDNSYIGTFINSKFIGKKIQIHHRKDCDEEIVNKSGNSEKEEYPSFEGSTFAYDCDSSNYVAFTINIAQFNFSDMDFGINSIITKINENEYEIKFRSPPIVPIPEDMDWKNYSKDSIISKIKYENNSFKFSWLGFYNNKTKKREYTKNPFTKKMENTPIILKKCE